MKAVLLIVLLAVLPTAAAGITVMSVSPAHGYACVAPGSYVSSGFTLFVNSSEQVEMIVQTSGPEWTYPAQNDINVSNVTAGLQVWASPPKGTPEGRYDTLITVCVAGEQVPNVTSVRSCLQPTFSVNVSAACGGNVMPDVRSALRGIITALIVVTAVVLAARLLKKRHKRP